MLFTLDKAIKEIIHNDLLSEEKHTLYEKSAKEVTLLKDVLEKYKNNYKDYAKLCNDLLVRIQEKYPTIKTIRLSEFNKNAQIWFSSSEKFISEKYYPDPRIFRISENDGNFYIMDISKNGETLKTKTFLENIKLELIEAQNYISTNPFVEHQHFCTISGNYIVSLHNDNIAVSFKSAISDLTHKHFHLIYNYGSNEYATDTNIHGCRKLMDREFEDYRTKQVVPGKQLLYSNLRVNSLKLPEHLR